MLSGRMQDALNRQIEHEFYSSFVYLAMSAHFERGNLPGFARWMRLQAGEEHVHAMGWCINCHLERKINRDCTACHY